MVILRFISLLLLAMLWLVTIGQSPVAGQTSAASPAAVPDAAPAPSATVAYLGVHAQYVSPALRSQLDLAEGVGLLVSFVQGDGPASAAGLVQHDVIEKFNDQLLVSPYQLKVLVRLAKPGQTVQLTVLRKGRRIELPLTLGSRDVPISELALSPVDAQPLPGEPAPGSLDQQALSRVLQQPGQALMISARQMSFTDAQHKIVVNDDQRGRHLRATNLQGEVLYDGYVNTPDEQAQVPEDVREKMKRLADLQRKNNIVDQSQASPDPSSGPEPQQNAPSE